MNFLISVLPGLLVGVSVLIVGILITKEPKRTRKKALVESMAWGAGFFVAFSLEALALSSL